MPISDQEALFAQFKQVWVDTEAEQRIVQLAHVANVRYPTAWNAIPYLRRAAELESSSAAVNAAVRAALDVVESEHAILRNNNLHPAHATGVATRAKIDAIILASPFWQQRRQFEEAVKAYLEKELSGLGHLALARAVDLDLSVSIPLLRGFTQSRAGDTDLLRRQLLVQGTEKATAMERALIQWNVEQFLAFEKTLEEPEWKPPTYSSGDRHYWAPSTYDQE